MSGEVETTPLPRRRSLSGSRNLEISYGEENGAFIEENRRRRSGSNSRIVDVSYPEDLQLSPGPAMDEKRRRSGSQSGAPISLYSPISETEEGETYISPAEFTSPNRRRSFSVAIAQKMDAIDERDDDSFEETLVFDLVCIGGGTAAGCWASSVASGAKDRGLTVAIISAYAQGIPPYRRSNLLKECVHCGAAEADRRDWNTAEFPAVDGHKLEWYKEAGVTILSSCQAVRCQLDKNFIVVRRIGPGATQQGLIKVQFQKLVIASGARPMDALWRKNQQVKGPAAGSCFCTRHKDIIVEGPSPKLKDPEIYGFGSLHSCTDIGDAYKLVAAMEADEADGQETCSHPVIVVGQSLGKWSLANTGALYAAAVAATIAESCNHLNVVLVIDEGVEGPDAKKKTMARESAQSRRAMEPLGIPRVVWAYYERLLSRAGVRVARGYRVLRPWALDEEGELPMLDTSGGGALRRTRPRKCGPVDPNYTTLRGLVLEDVGTGDPLWIEARFVVAGMKTTPNSEVFTNNLTLDAEGSIVVDTCFRTSHPSGNVYAMGDVAAFAGSSEIDVGGGSPGVKYMCDAHAEASAKRVAALMLGEKEAEAPYTMQPYMSGKFAGTHWFFAGTMIGDAVVMNIDEEESTSGPGSPDELTQNLDKTQENGRKNTAGVQNSSAASATKQTAFAVVWAKAGKMMGTFMGCPSDMADVLAMTEAAVRTIGRDQPRLRSIQQLRHTPLADLVADPHLLCPQELAAGEFEADTDEASIAKTFQRHETQAGVVTVEMLGELMEELGADWNVVELEAAKKAMDPTDSGTVTFDVFRKWWLG